MGRKRITNQESRIAKLEAELLEARKAQLLYDQKQFEQLEEQMDASQRKYDRLTDRINKEEDVILRLEEQRMQALGRKSDLIQELEELQTVMEEQTLQRDIMMAEAEELPADVTGN